MIGHLFLPRRPSPPFATVIYYPSGAAFGMQSSDNLGPEILDFLMAGGRAVFYPTFLSTFERRDGFNLGQVKKNVWRDHCLKWSQDLGVSIDYLETRSDIDKDKLAFYGFSQGGIVGPVLLAMEPRIKAAVLEAGGFLGGGLTSNLAPEADPFNFAPRVKIPVLMLNGRYDILRRPEEEQDQLFRWLGTPPENKFRKIYETDHHAPRLERIKEVTAFLDKYLGSVK
jgi:dienelactone hydrolase